MRFYYQDLSHSQPLARETLAWMLKEVGFDSVDVIQSSPATRELGVDQQCQMCQELASQDQEYLVIGVKA